MGGSSTRPTRLAGGRVFVVAVNCGVAGGTCFCVSMGTGPRATFGYDVVLTELMEDGRRGYLADAASDRGAELLSSLTAREATSEEEAEGDRIVERTAARFMGRQLDTAGFLELLAMSRDHPRWDEVAGAPPHLRKLHDGLPDLLLHDGRGRDRPDRRGGRAAPGLGLLLHLDFAPARRGVRTTPKARYRQWLTHKLGTWHAQFGESGCVGCGRCITWCPVGIDITEEAAALREDLAMRIRSIEELLVASQLFADLAEPHSPRSRVAPRSPISTRANTSSARARQRTPSMSSAA